VQNSQIKNTVFFNIENIKIFLDCEKYFTLIY
jgi:hypothetical protein